MNTSLRWPLHPAPVQGEALSAWLARVAQCYEMDLMDLLLYEWGQDKISDIDIRPPDGFLEIISERSGVDLGELRCMTMIGWVPWLLDSFEIEDEAFICYVKQFSVLLPQAHHHIRSVPRWRAWLSKHDLIRACPICICRDSEKNIFKLAWEFPLLISCPLHGCLLETYYLSPGIFYNWDDKVLTPRPANYAITEMDYRTEQAFATGQVNLPRRNVHAGVWFRLLRTIIHELSTPLSHCGNQAKEIIRKIWGKTGHPCRAGLHIWHPFESLDLPKQLQFLEAAAVAINMIESGKIEALGADAFFFLPEPKSVIEIGCQPLKTLKPEPIVIDHWKIAMDSLNQAIDEARYDPECAKALFRMIMFGRTDEKHIIDVKKNFKLLGIPQEWCQIE